MTLNPALFGGGQRQQVKLRRGLVRPVGKALTDDTGLFHPLGITMMWALYGAKFERPRYEKHLDFLAGKVDYQRILGQVKWDGEEIDPLWPDYEEILGWTIDAAHQRGIRTDICVFGSGKYIPDGLLPAVKRIENVINAARQEKVIAVKVSNEGFQNGPDLPTTVMLARHLRASIPNLVGLSSCGDKDQPPDWDIMAMAVMEAGATVHAVHIDRGDGDFGWRSVRQGWDFRSLNGVVDSEEPPGPHSSVRSEENPLLLAMMRATGIISGGAMYTLHIGDMVAGRVDPAHNRQANIWEVPNIDQILAVMRGLDAMLPDGVENWTKINGQWAEHPLKSDNFWPGGDHGLQRGYTAANDQGFTMMCNGVWRKAVLTAQRPMHVDAYDPVTGKIPYSRDMAAGEMWGLLGSEDTLTGYIVQGKFL